MQKNPKELYKNPNISVDERVLDLLERMTLEEKVGQMIQLDGSHDPEIWVKQRNIGSYLNLNWQDCQRIQNMALHETRLGIPVIFGIDAVHGHCFGDERATIFPTQLSLSCSWDPELVHQTATITAKEVIQTGHHWTFSPILCIGRDPRWGRINETFGEDPYLIGVLAEAKIQGYQGKNLSDPESILSCPKHFVAYGETVGGRDSAEASVSKRQLKSIFLPPFQRAIHNAQAGSIMAGYHSIDGIPCSANKWLLKEILKKEWNFHGFVLTDWMNINWLHTLQNVAPTLQKAIEIGLKAGNDMIMSTPEFYDHIIYIVKNGEISEEFIDVAVTRILTMKFKLGLFDGKAIRKTPPDSKVIGCTTHRNLALKAALESIVLLKNANDILPLSDTIGKVAVIGPNADYWIAQLGDWSFKTGNMQQDEVLLDTREHEDSTITILEGIKRRLKGKSKIVYSKGCHITNSNIEEIDKAVNIAIESDVIIAVVGDTHGLNGERKDRATLNLPGAQLKLLKALKKTKKPLIAVLINGKPLDIRWLAKNADAILETFNPGCEGGNAVAKIIFGDYNPSGKLSISFPKTIGQIPVYYNQLPGWHSGRYIDLDSRYLDGGVVVPLYPFGFGLSYTSFEYSNLKLSNKTIKMNDTLQISVDVKNSGNSKGDEIVQLYVNDKFSSCTTPIKELKDFKKITLEKNETKTVIFHLSSSSLGFINSDLEYLVEEGEFEVFVGGSSKDDDLLRATFFIKRI